MALALCTVCLLVAGCSTAGPDYSALPDPSNQAVPEGIPAEPGSDENTILAAVASADLEAAPSLAIAWTNAQNGNSGAITIVEEKTNGQRVCREFVGSRQSYNGFSQYSGEACRNRRGNDWTLKVLEIQE